MQSWEERPNSFPDDKEMFLAKLLIGNAIRINRDESPSKEAECRALTVPPIEPISGLKYNTVTGDTGGSQVWIVYENGRAYPDYLIRYYRGTYNKSRTPFMNQAKAMDSLTRIQKKKLFSTLDVEIVHYAKE
jgi:hypothetical protein